MKQERLAGIFGTGTLFILLSAFTGNDPLQEREPWKVPAAADSVRSPISFSPEITKKGEEFFNLYCIACHGETGLGDGPAGAQLVIKPANFREERVKKQSDGSIFWKITTGRGAMPPFKEVLKDEERWQLVSYVRKLSKQN